MKSGLSSTQSNRAAPDLYERRIAKFHPGAG
jgi:hypothetical protein